MVDWTLLCLMKLKCCSRETAMCSACVYCTDLVGVHKSRVMRGASEAVAELVETCLTLIGGLLYQCLDAQTKFIQLHGNCLVTFCFEAPCIN